jgi:hypothetical protein
MLDTCDSCYSHDIDDSPRSLMTQSGALCRFYPRLQLNAVFAAVQAKVFFQLLLNGLW